MKKLLILLLMMMSLNCLGTSVWAAPTEPSCTAPTDNNDKNLAEGKSDGSKDAEKSTATTIQEPEKK